MFSLTPEMNTALIGFVVALLAYFTSTLKTKIADIQKEVSPNHGSSTRDAIDRTEATQRIGVAERIGAERDRCGNMIFEPAARRKVE